MLFVSQGRGRGRFISVRTELSEPCLKGTADIQMIIALVFHLLYFCRMVKANNRSTWSRLKPHREQPPLSDTSALGTELSRHGQPSCHPSLQCLSISPCKTDNNTEVSSGHLGVSSLRGSKHSLGKGLGFAW